MNVARLLPQRTVPRPGEPPPDKLNVEGYERAVVGVMRDLSRENRRRLWLAAEELAAAEHAGKTVETITIVIAPPEEARA